MSNKVKFTGRAGNLFLQSAASYPGLPSLGCGWCLSEWHPCFMSTVLSRDSDLFSAYLCQHETYALKVSWDKGQWVPSTLSRLWLWQNLHTQWLFLPGTELLMRKADSWPLLGRYHCPQLVAKGEKNSYVPGLYLSREPASLWAGEAWEGGSRLWLKCHRLSLFLMRFNRLS